MDEHGIDHVSLNAINRASGHRNRSAINYHFGSREAIVRELLGRTMVTLDAERNTLLDHLETTNGALSERDAIEILVGPLARQLLTPDGRRFLRLCGQVVNHPRYVADARETLQVNSSTARCVRYLASAFAQLPESIATERRSQLAGLAIRALAEQARLLDTKPPPRPPLPIEAFTANLVDVLLAVLTAPTSVGRHP
jgi:AcrR family transcriptional regulator